MHPNQQQHSSLQHVRPSRPAAPQRQVQYSHRRRRRLCTAKGSGCGCTHCQPLSGAEAALAAHSGWLFLMFARLTWPCRVTASQRVSIRGYSATPVSQFLQ